MLDLIAARPVLERFMDADQDRHSLGLVYGRRRIGKSTLLHGLVVERGGFYWEATRTTPAVQLERLGRQLGAHLGVGRVTLSTWEEALEALWRLGKDRPTPVVLDEFGHVIEADPSVPSVVATMLGPAGQAAQPGRTRLVLCGSAIAMMRELTGGEAPLRGRAGVEVVMQPADYRAARRWSGAATDALAVAVHGVIGGVVGYATDMVDHDLPVDEGDFDRWVRERVLSPAATLHREALTLLAEDPTLPSASAGVHHAILAAIALGSVTAGTISGVVGRSAAALSPHLNRLVDAGFVTRHLDPVRKNRPTYALADPLLQFHYAILEPYATALRASDDLRRLWQERLEAVFRSRVLGPVVEEQARTWARRFADAETLGGPVDALGPSAAVIAGVEHELDLVAASPSTAEPSARTVQAIGEVKSGEVQGVARLRGLEQRRAALGTRAAAAKLLLVGPSFTEELAEAAAGRSDVELVDFARLHRGS